MISMRSRAVSWILVLTMVFTTLFSNTAMVAATTEAPDAAQTVATETQPAETPDATTESTPDDAAAEATETEPTDVTESTSQGEAVVPATEPEPETYNVDLFMTSDEDGVFSAPAHGDITFEYADEHGHKVTVTGEDLADAANDEDIADGIELPEGKKVTVTFEPELGYETFYYMAYLAADEDQEVVMEIDDEDDMDFTAKRTATFEVGTDDIIVDILFEKVAGEATEGEAAVGGSETTDNQQPAREEAVVWAGDEPDGSEGNPFIIEQKDNLSFVESELYNKFVGFWKKPSEYTITWSGLLSSGSVAGNCFVSAIGTERSWNDSSWRDDSFIHSSDADEVTLNDGEKCTVRVYNDSKYKEGDTLGYVKYRLYFEPVITVAGMPELAEGEAYPVEFATNNTTKNVNSGNGHKFYATDGATLRAVPVEGTDGYTYHPVVTYTDDTENNTLSLNEGKLDLTSSRDITVTYEKIVPANVTININGMGTLSGIYGGEVVGGNYPIAVTPAEDYYVDSIIISNTTTNNTTNLLANENDGEFTGTVFTDDTVEIINDNNYTIEVTFSQKILDVKTSVELGYNGYSNEIEGNIASIINATKYGTTNVENPSLEYYYYASVDVERISSFIAGVLDKLNVDASTIKAWVKIGATEGTFYVGERAIENVPVLAFGHSGLDSTEQVYVEWAGISPYPTVKSDVCTVTFTESRTNQEAEINFGGEVGATSETNPYIFEDADQLIAKLNEKNVTKVKTGDGTVKNVTVKGNVPSDYNNATKITVSVEFNETENCKGDADEVEIWVKAKTPPAKVTSEVEGVGSITIDGDTNFDEVVAGTHQLVVTPGNSESGYIASIVVENITDATSTDLANIPANASNFNGCKYTGNVTFEAAKAYKITVTFADRAIPTKVSEKAEVKLNLNTYISLQRDAFKTAAYNAIVNTEITTIPAGITASNAKVMFEINDGDEWYPVDTDNLIEIGYLAAVFDMDHHGTLKVVWPSTGRYPEVETGEIKITVTDERNEVPGPIEYTGKTISVDALNEINNDDVVKYITTGATETIGKITVSRVDNILPAEGVTENITYNVTIAGNENYKETKTTVEVPVKNLQHLTTIKYNEGKLYDASGNEVTDSSVKSGTYNLVVTPGEAQYVESVAIAEGTSENTIALGTGIYSKGENGCGGVYTIPVTITNDAIADTTVNLTATIADYAIKENTYNNTVDNRYEVQYNPTEAWENQNIEDSIISTVISYNEGDTVTVSAVKRELGKQTVTITWTDNAVANKYPTLTGTYDVTLTDERVYLTNILTAPNAAVTIPLESESLDVVKTTIIPNVPEGVEIDSYIVTGKVPLQGQTGKATLTVVTSDDHPMYRSTTQTIDVDIIGAKAKAKVTVDYDNTCGTVTGIETGEYDTTTASITVTPKEGYYVTSVQVNGEPINTNQNSLAFTWEQVIEDGATQGLALIDGTPEYNINIGFAKRDFTVNENQQIFINPTDEITDDYIAGIEAQIKEILVGAEIASKVNVKFKFGIGEIDSNNLPDALKGIFDWIKGLIGDADKYYGLSEDLNYGVGTVSNFYFNYGFATALTGNVFEDIESIEVTLPQDGKKPEIVKCVDLKVVDSRETINLDNSAYEYSTVNTDTVQTWIEAEYAKTLPEDVSVKLTKTTETELPTEYNVPTAVKYSVEFTGNEKYRPANTEITVTVTKLNPACTVTVGTAVEDKGTITVNGTTATEPVPVDSGTNVTIAVTPNAGYAVKSVKVHEAAATVADAEPVNLASEITYANGVATVTFTADGSNGGVNYVVDVDYETAGFTFNDSYAVKYNVAPTEKNVYEQIVAAPTLEEGDTCTVKYMARPAGTQSVNIPKLTAYGITIYEGGTREFQMDELWMPVGTPIEEVDLNEELAKVEAMVAQISSPADAIKAADYVRDLIERIPSMQIGAHEFAGLGAGSTEQVRVSYSGSKYIIGETETTVTIKDGRIATEIAGADGSVYYGATEADVIKALGIDVVANGASVGTPVIETKIDKLGASETPYMITVKYAGNETYQPATRVFNLTVKKAPCEIDFDSQVVTWGEDYNFDVVTNPAGVNTIDFMIGLDMEALSTENLVPVGYVQLKLPGLLGTMFEEATTVNEVIEKLEQLTGLTDSTLEGLGIDAETLNMVMNTLNSFQLDLGVLGETKVKINGEFKPDNIGVYLAGAVTADDNYETAYTADYLVVLPDATSATMEYNYVDDNGIITANLIEDGVIDLGAKAVVEGEYDAEATKEIQHLFIKMDENGEFTPYYYNSNGALNTDAARAELSDMGAYAQLSFILDWGNELYYGEPIGRAYAVMHELVDVTFVNENGEETRDFVYTYTGSETAPTVKVTDAYGKEVTDLEGKLTVKYYGYSLNDPKAIYNSTVAPTDAGVYTATAIYQDKEDSAYGMDVAGMVINPAEAAIAVDNQVVKYNTSYGDGVTVTTPVAGDDCKYITMVAGVDASGDFSKEGINAFDAAANIDFPTRIDNVLKPILGGAYESGLSVNKVIQETDKVAAALEKAGFDAEAIDTVIDFLNQLPQTKLGNATVTFHDWNKGGAPANVGMYVVGAVTCDPNYTVAADYGFLAVTPDGVRVDLAFNIEDENGFITKSAIADKSYDLGAHVVNADTYTEDVNSYVHNLYIGVNEANGLVMSAEPVAELGVYDQVAYIVDPSLNEVYYAQPISRTYVVVPELADVQFENSDDLRTEIYTGEGHAMAATAIDKDGEELAGVTVRYIGYDANDIEIYNSTEAPVNVGTYTVVASYVDKAADVYGMRVGKLVIVPARADIDVTSAVGKYDPDFRFTDQISAKASGTVVSGDTPAYVAIARGIEGEGYLSIDQLDFVDGVVVVDFPDRVDALLKAIPAMAPLYEGEGVDVADFAIHKAGIETVLKGLKVDENAIAQIMAELAAVEELADVTVRFAEMEEVKVNIGTYVLTAIECDPNFQPAVGVGVISIVSANPDAEIVYDYEIEGGVLELDQAEEFKFSAHIRDKDNSIDDTKYNITHMFYGVDENGMPYLSSEAPRELGSYTQVSVTNDVANNVYITAAARSFEITRITTAITVVTKDSKCCEEADNVTATIADRLGRELKGDAPVLNIVITDAKGNVVENPTAAGTYNVTVTFEGNSIYKAAEATGEFTIEHAYADKLTAGETTHWYECACGDKTGEAEHNFKFGYVDTEPTCTTDGKAIHVCECGAIEEVVLEKTGHTAGKVAIENKVDATCTAAGSYDEVTYCDVCHVAIDRVAVTVPKLGHKYTAAVTAPTCTEKGYTTYTCACGDSYVADYTDSTGHTAGEVVIENEVAATCTKAGSYEEVVYCTVCDEELSREVKTIDKLDHELGDWVYDHDDHWKVCGKCEDIFHKDAHEFTVETTDATCTADGVKTYTCACGYTYTEDIPAIAHTPGKAVKENEIEATCTKAGSYEEVVYCTVCDEELSRDVKTIDKLAHKLGDWVYDHDDHWKVCGKCEEIFNKAAHELTEKVTTPATCTADGVKTYTCACGYTYTEDIPAIDHSFEWKVIKEATEEAEGLKQQICKDCGAEGKEEAIAKLAHTHKYTAAVTAPTCDKEGYTTYTCACGDSYVADKVAAKGHNFEWKVITKPTVDADGLKQQICKDCGATGESVKLTVSEYVKSVAKSMEELADYDVTRDNIEDAKAQAEAIRKAWEGLTEEEQEQIGLERLKTLVDFEVAVAEVKLGIAEDIAAAEKELADAKADQDDIERALRITESFAKNIKAKVVNKSQVKVTWEHPQIIWKGEEITPDAYRLTLITNKGKKVTTKIIDGSETTYTFKNLLRGAKYRVRITPVGQYKDRNFFSHYSVSNWANTGLQKATLTVKKSGANKLIVSKDQNATGYQIWISKDKKFKKGVKKINVVTNKAGLKKVVNAKNFAKGKNYVKVRAYTNNGEKKVYGKWSGTVTVKK